MSATYHHSLLGPLTSSITRGRSTKRPAALLAILIGMLAMACMSPEAPEEVSQEVALIEVVVAFDSEKTTLHAMEIIDALADGSAVVQASDTAFHAHLSAMAIDLIEEFDGRVHYGGPSMDDKSCSWFGFCW